MNRKSSLAINAYRKRVSPRIYSAFLPSHRRSRQINLIRNRYSKPTSRFSKLLPANVAQRARSLRRMLGRGLAIYPEGVMRKTAAGGRVRGGRAGARGGRRAAVARPRALRPRAALAHPSGRDVKITSTRKLNLETPPKNYKIPAQRKAGGSVSVAARSRRRPRRRQSVTVN
ncbi:hypothetical protein EVAR_30594_1 [Eumeta japonica]|uniref:Uncharacterized protein n=1 Tax=Eumeta variegata TaxID=151549 RepID=A0A4C1W802_EUMVA|nr:hypothetical protein EVAR_30594_1 [Eumeta japonica]